MFLVRFIVISLTLLQESVHRRSEDNSRRRSQKLPLILRIDVTGEVYNYGPQALNSAELAKEQLRQMLSKVSGVDIQTVVHVCVCHVHMQYNYWGISQGSSEVLKYHHT